MNYADKILFESLESAWVTYFSKCKSRDEIPWQAESVLEKMVMYEGQLPQQSGHKPDVMPSIIDRYRKFSITTDEDNAAKAMFSVATVLRDFVMLEPLIRRSPDPTTGLIPNQAVIAAMCRCTLDQYKKRRAQAKKEMLWNYKKVRGLVRGRVNTT